MKMQFFCLWWHFMLSFGSATLLGSLFAEKKVHAYVMSAVPSRVPNVKDFMMRLGLSDVHYDLVGAPTNITNPVIERHIRDGELSPFYSYSKYHSGIKRYVVQRTKIKILRNFLRSKYDTMIMFEDDVALNTEYFDEEGAVTATAAMLNTADKWDLQYLGFCFECKHVGGGGKHNFLEIPGFQSSKEDFYYQTAFMPLCNHAVIFSKKAAKAFIELSRPFHFPGDLILTHIICLTGMVAIRPSVPIFIQSRETLGSTIGNDNKLETFRDENDPGNKRCNGDENLCRKLYNPLVSKMYGFSK